METTKKTIADKLEIQFESMQKVADYDEKGRLMPYEAFDALVAKACALAVTKEYPFGTDSYDATIICEFEDGSRVWIGNPNQATYQIEFYRTNSI